MTSMMTMEQPFMTLATTMPRPTIVTSTTPFCRDVVYDSAVAVVHKDAEMLEASFAPMVEILVHSIQDQQESADEEEDEMDDAVSPSFSKSSIVGFGDDLDDEGIGDEDREFELFRKYPLRIFNPLAILREEEEEGPIDLEALKSEIRAKAVRPTKKPSGLKPGKRAKKMIGPPPPAGTKAVGSIPKVDKTAKDFFC